MKVRTKEPDFRPVQITIETQEEYDLLYNLLNNATSNTFDEYKSNMWRSIESHRITENMDVDYHD